MTKAQKLEASRKAAVRRRVAVALAKYLKQANPGMTARAVRVQKLKGGVIKITPVKGNAPAPFRGENYYGWGFSTSGPYGRRYTFGTRQLAEAARSKMRREGYSSMSKVTKNREPR